MIGRRANAVANTPGSPIGALGPPEANDEAGPPPSPGFSLHFSPAPSIAPTEGAASTLSTFPPQLIEEVHEIIDQRRIETSFQPICHLTSAEIVGFEAFARGPAGSALESPADLFAAAQAVGRTAELDWLCAAAAWEAASLAHLHPSMTIFLNFKPTTLLTACPEDLYAATRRARERLRVVVEIQETMLTADPGRLFEVVAAVREEGWGIAIDNATAAAATIALLPLVRPDVLKLDLRASRGDLTAIADMSDGAVIYAEESGAKILAQGIETSEDVLVARFAGASHGQGWHIGHPGRLPSTRAVPRSVFPLLAAPPPIEEVTPFEIVTAARESLLTEQRFLEPMWRHLEEQIDLNGPRALLLMAIEDGGLEDDARCERVRALAPRAAFTAVVGAGAHHLGTFGNGVRLAEVSNADAIAGERDLIVLGPHYAVALVARGVEVAESGPHRRFAYALTHDRDLILLAARALLARLATAREELPAL